MEILRFGPGFRRTEPPAGAQGLADQVIWSDARARITELAFTRRALIPPQTSPDLGLFIVVAGGGWVQVGDERTAINHGEAVEWPPGVAHGAWTDGSSMRAILVEVPDLAIEATSPRPADPPEVTDLEPARGRLAEREARPGDHDPAEGEPW
jgi:quercetin dioxygenase-like cupin family protein